MECLGQTVPGCLVLAQPHLSLGTGEQRTGKQGKGKHENRGKGIFTGVVAMHVIFVLPFDPFEIQIISAINEF